MATRKDKEYYLGNPTLPNAKAEFDYGSHPEWVLEIEKCKKNILYFAENYFYIISLDEGRQKIQLRSYQKRILRALRDNRFIILLASRQSSKTTLMMVFALWQACFEKDQTILIAANKEDTAIGIFKRVRLAYEELPNWLKPGIASGYGKTSMELANGSRIGISTTSTDTARGSSCNVLILDELAAVASEISASYWASVYPIISASKKSKIFIASTPNGTDNLFYKIWDGAVKKENNWHPERVDWWDVPGRDEKWKEETIKNLGNREIFDVEFGNCVSGNSILDISINGKKKKITIKKLYEILYT